MTEALEAVALRIQERSGAADARRRAAVLAVRLGFGETAAGGVAIAVTELATNLVKHAGRGELIVQPVAEGTRLGLDIVSIDRGPGMQSIPSALRDGYSTSGSSGTGLGAVGRLADYLDIHSTPGAGTVVVARLWARPRMAHEPAPRLDVAGFSVALAGEAVCGDAWAHRTWPVGMRALVVDGLGHGADAADAARRAVELLDGEPGPAACLERLHAGLRGTRGAAAAVVDIDLDRERACFAGVGNVAGAVIAGGVAHNMVSHNGTLGHDARRFAEFSYAFARGAVLVLHSDGLSNRWTLDAYPGLAIRRPGVIAGVLYRDFRRERDDATIVVACAARGDDAP